MSTSLSPLEQLEQQSAQAQPSTQAAPASNLSPLEQLEQSTQKQQAPPSGQLTNDVGNTVIVPKDGESFADTMQRAAAYGKTVTPSQINAETATAPAKAATVMGAAPVIGAAGAAGLAGAGELPGAAERFLQVSEKALEHLGENYPQLTKLAAKLGYGAGAAGAYKLLNKLGLH
jgi:hypothetical protein